MSVAPPLTPGALSHASTPPTREAAHKANAEKAAVQFEAILMQQLFKVLRKTIPDGGLLGEGNDLYMDMIDDAVSKQLAEQGGMGLRPLLERALGGDAEDAEGTLHSGRTPAFSVGPASAPTGAPLRGLSALVQQSAAELLQSSADRFSREGMLQPEDLGSGVSTEAPGGVARFSVRDAHGYQGYYKCNLFALELARRSGFQVPLVARDQGWGYPLANTVTADAADRQMEASWARVVTGETAASLDGSLVQGTRAFMLSGSGMDERHGHMAIVERVHQVDYDGQGHIQRVVFDGWESRAQGAEHLVQRTWNRYGNPGGSLARNGFDRIEILELRPPTPGSRPEVLLSSRAHASNLDGFDSSSAPGRPNARSEGRP